ncbi:MAG: cell division protein FtsL [Actinobacteria bacterium]|nr:cell division protein FtsL [Actinomycetota bacterium]
MAAAAQARRAEAAPRRQEQPERVPAQPALRRAPQARRRAAQRARLTRVFVIFVICLTVLAVGRVSLSFAVVQKTLQTAAVVREERALSAENERLVEKLAQMGSTVRIRHIAETQLGLVDADHVQYLRVTKGARLAKAAQRP